MSIGVLMGPPDSLPLCDACGTEPAAAVVRDGDRELNACAGCLFMGIEEVGAKRPPDVRLAVRLDLRASGFVARQDIAGRVAEKLTGLVLHARADERITINAVRILEIG